MIIQVEYIHIDRRYAAVMIKFIYSSGKNNQLIWVQNNNSDDSTIIVLYQLLISAVYTYLLCNRINNIKFVCTF